MAPPAGATGGAGVGVAATAGGTVGVACVGRAVAGATAGTWGAAPVTGVNGPAAGAVG